MVKRDPHAVLGLQQGASAAAVKAAWRKLARRHHPDLSGSDTGAARMATKLMAEINAAYEQLRDGGASRRAPEADRGRPRTGGPPPPKPSRPVTAHLDMTGVLRPRNATTTTADGRRAHPIAAQAPIRSRAGIAEFPRASDPNGPLVRSRVRRFRRPAPPTLEAALATEMPFGKFHGHTLGQIAGFEPSYIDWVAGTILRDPDLVAAATVVRDDLDRRGVVRRIRPTHKLDLPTDAGAR
jgi:curved DNA-binding protein CbpA